MKINNFYLLLSLAGLFIVVGLETATAQKFSDLDKSPHDIVYYRTERSAPPLVKVLYGRPQRKGRSLSDELTPYGKVWRTGANEATEIRFYKDVRFGNMPIKAGTYSLFTIPGKNEWVFILNSDLDVWGAYSYNEKNDVARVSVPVKQGAESLEAFSIGFKQGEKEIYLVLGWDTVRVEVPIVF